MIGRTRFVLTFAGVVVSLVSVVAAQPTTSGGNEADVLHAIQQLRADLPGLVKREVDASMRNFVTEYRFDTEVRQLRALLAAREIELRDLKADYESNKQLINSQLADQRRILEAISTTDTYGTRTLALNNMMSSSSQFRGEMRQAVNASIHPRGTLHVSNHMKTDQKLTVNGRDYWLAPDQSISVPVDVGTVTTELVGVEAPKNWTVCAPTYHQDVIIGPRPPGRVVVNSPVVYPYPGAIWTSP